MIKRYECEDIFTKKDLEEFDEMNEHYVKLNQSRILCPDCYDRIKNDYGYGAITHIRAKFRNS